jgi:hypothetical protein
MWSAWGLYNAYQLERSRAPGGGGFEYLHSDSASRRRRRKGKTQIWDSKRWSRVPRDSDPRKTTLARASSIYKRQTRPLVRESAPDKQARNCQKAINIWSWAPDGARHQDLPIDWPSVAMWILLITADNDSEKRQTHPLVREDAPQKQDRDYQTVINIHWLTDRQVQCDFDFDLDETETSAECS